jgi:hypothetical protein
LNSAILDGKEQSILGSSDKESNGSFLVGKNPEGFLGFFHVDVRIAIVNYDCNVFSCLCSRQLCELRQNRLFCICT